jgi:hypothetical protein
MKESPLQWIRFLIFYLLFREKEATLVRLDNLVPVENMYVCTQSIFKHYNPVAFRTKIVTRKYYIYIYILLLD